MQREDRQVGHDDDGDGVEHRALNLVGGPANGFRGAFHDRGVGAVIALAHVPKDVLHHNHGPVYHHANANGQAGDGQIAQ